MSIGNDQGDASLANLQCKVVKLQIRFGPVVFFAADAYIGRELSLWPILGAPAALGVASGQSHWLYISYTPKAPSDRNDAL